MTDAHRKAQAMCNQYYQHKTCALHVQLEAARNMQAPSPTLMQKPEEPRADVMQPATEQRVPPPCALHNPRWPPEHAPVVQPGNLSAGAGRGDVRQRRCT